MSFWAETAVIISIFFIILPIIFCIVLSLILKRKGIQIKLWWKATGAVIQGLFLLIFIPNYLTIGQRSPDSVMQGVLKNACYSASAILSKHPDKKSISLEDLEKSGFIFSDEIELIVLDNTRESFKMRVRYKDSKISGKVYEVDRECNIKEAQK